MRAKLFRIKYVLVCAVIAVISIGCGPTAGNQNNSGNRNTDVKSNSSNAQVKTEANAEIMSTTCTAADDTQIERQIRVLIEEDPILRPHNRRINVDSKYCVVKLYGYVDTWPKFKLLYEKVSNADGVRKVDIANFDIRAGTAASEQCQSPLKQCGELCVPPETDCTIPADSKSVQE